MKRYIYYENIGGNKVNRQENNMNLNQIANLNLVKLVIPTTLLIVISFILSFLKGERGVLELIINL